MASDVINVKRGEKSPETFPRLSRLPRHLFWSITGMRLYLDIAKRVEVRLPIGPREKAVVVAQEQPSVSLHDMPTPCPHARTGRRADGTLVCLACVAVYAGGVWTSQTIAYCATEHVPYESTSTDGPTRQCQACPHAWQVPCACGTASWKPDAHWGPDGAGMVRWTCTSCGTPYASDPRVLQSPRLSTTCHRRTEPPSRWHATPPRPERHRLRQGPHRGPRMP